MSFLYQTYPFVIELQRVAQLDTEVLISSLSKSLINLIVQQVQVLSLTSLSFPATGLCREGTKSPPSEIS